MALCRIASRSSWFTFRAGRAGFPSTAAMEQVVYGARRQFWSVPEHKRIEQNLIDILDTKLTAINDYKVQELKYRAFATKLDPERKIVKLTRYFNNAEWIEITAKRDEWKAEAYVDLGVTISRHCDSETLVLKFELQACDDNIEITKLEAGKVDPYKINSVMQYLKVRGIDKDTVDYLRRCMAKLPKIEAMDKDAIWMNNLNKFLKNEPEDLWY